MPPVVAGVALQQPAPPEHVLADEAPVGAWLTPMVKELLSNIDLECDATWLSERCALVWCQLHTTKQLRSCKRDAPGRFAARLAKLACGVLCTALGRKEDELNSDDTDRLEDLAAALTEIVTEKLEEKVASKPQPVAVPAAVQPLPSVEEEETADARQARRKVLAADLLKAPMRLRLQKAQRQHGNELGADGKTPVYDGWTIGVETVAKKPKGMPRGKTAATSDEGKACAREEAERRRQEAAGAPEYEDVVVFECNICSKPLRSFEGLHLHRTKPKSCERRRLPMPVDTQVQEAAAAASTHGSGANDARYDSLLFPRRHHRHRRALALRQCCVIVALRTNGAVHNGRHRILGVGQLEHQRRRIEASLDHRRYRR